MTRRRGTWLLLAVALLGLATGLMLSGQGDEAVVETPRVSFPQRLRPEERQRVEQRRTYTAPRAAVVDAGPAKPRDPVLAALPRGKGKTAMVIEANAIRHSPIGELLLECLMNRGGQNLEKFKKATGVDPLEDLDRLVITDDGVIVSGNFGNQKLKEALAGMGVPSYDYGQGARLYDPPIERTLPDGRVVRRDAPPMGFWNDQMLVFGKSADGVKEVIDRVEGRGPDEPPAIDENSTYGEMYGVLSVEQLKKLFPADQRELADRLAQVAQNVELHVDASSDFAMTANVTGADAAQMTDLGKSLGGALSLARMKAQAEGHKEVAQLLDFASVKPEGSRFNLQMAVPLDVIQQQLAFCRQKQNAPATEEDAPEEDAPEEDAPEEDAPQR